MEYEPSEDLMERWAIKELKNSSTIEPLDENGLSSVSIPWNFLGDYMTVLHFDVAPAITQKHPVESNRNQFQRTQ